MEDDEPMMVLSFRMAKEHVLMMGYEVRLMMAVIPVSKLLYILETLFIFNKNPFLCASI